MKLNSFQKSQIKALSNKWHLKLLFIHGSQSTGQTHPKSDLDLAYLQDRHYPFSLLTFISDVQTIFHGSQVDVANLDQADPLLLHEIQVSGQLLFGKEKDLLTFQLTCYHRYSDYLPYLKLEHLSVREFLRS